MWNIRVPLSIYWTASKDVEEEEAERPEANKYHANFENPFVSSLHRNSEEEDRDTKLDEHDIENVEHRRQRLVLAKPSVLLLYRILGLTFRASNLR